MEEILKDALFLANVCDTLQISGYIKQELFDEHAALVENINETTARVFKYAAQQSVQADGWQCAACKEANVGFDDCCVNLLPPATLR